MKGLLLLLLLLTSCARGDYWLPANRARIDSVTQATALMARMVAAKKVTITGPVTFTYQYGQGNQATSTPTDNTQAGKKASAPAIGAGSSARATAAGTPWWVYAGLVALGLAGGWLLRARASGVPGLDLLLHAVPWL